MARYIEPWIKNGELRGTSAKTVIFSLIAIVVSHGAFQRMFLGEDFSPEDMFAACVDLHSVRVD